MSKLVFKKQDNDFKRYLPCVLNVNPCFYNHFYLFHTVVVNLLCKEIINKPLTCSVNVEIVLISV